MKPAISFYDELKTEPALIADVLQGFEARSISPKFFYDTRGSELFEAICRLPEYYLTRTETAILRACARDIARRTGSGAVLIELGSGASEKVRLLLDALRPAAYLGIDISREDAAAPFVSILFGYDSYIITIFYIWIGRR